MRRLPLDIEILDQLPILARDLGTFDALAIDIGGVGAAVPGLIRQMVLPQLGAVLPVAIVAGVNQRENRGRVIVGKARLVGHLEAAIRDGRVSIDPRMPGASDLRDELVLFTRRGGKAEAIIGHDDMVVALALAVWCADTCLGRDTALPGFPANFDGRPTRPDDWRTKDWHA